MTVTISAIVFLIGILALTVLGVRLLRKNPQEAAQMYSEKCILCKHSFNKNDLILREIGDYKLLYFCRSCILKLYADVGLKK